MRLTFKLKRTRSAPAPTPITPAVKLDPRPADEILKSLNAPRPVLRVVK